MSKIILNPEDGARIQNVQVKGKFLFKESPFEVDTMKKIENDEVADVLLNLYGFLKELEGKEEVEAYIAERKNRAFKCAKCGNAFSVEIALKGHQRKHDSEEKIVDEYGIEVISDEALEVSAEDLEKQREQAEKAHLRSIGVDGGWEDDTPRRGAIM